jgi:hypothetical protein
MAKCDLCDQNCASHELVQLLDQYQIPRVVDICPDCATWADKVKVALLNKISTEMREAIAERKGVSLIRGPSFIRRLLK